MEIRQIKSHFSGAKAEKTLWKLSPLFVDMYQMLALPNSLACHAHVETVWHTWHTG